MLKKVALSMVAFATISQANVFSIKVDNTTQGDSFEKGFSSVTDTIDSLDTDAIMAEINYNPTDAVSATVDFRGLPLTLDYTANSTTLTLNIPSLGITETFTGTTRDDSVSELTDWLKKNGGSVVEKIMKKLAEVSPVDPIAGNPNSMMGLSVANDFSSGFMSVSTKQGSSVTSSSAKNENSLMIAPSYSSLEVDGKNSDSYMLPIAYSFKFNRDSREKITISMPITYTDVEGSKAYSLAFGLAYSKPITKNWILTPAISYGASGSIDLGALAQVASGSLTSAYKWNLPNDYTLSMGNMVGYYATVKLYDGDYAYDPGIKNVVYRNALMLNIPTDYLIRKTSLEIYAIDTRYTGTALYMEEYQEYGMSFGYDAVNLNVLSDTEQYAVRKRLKVGMSYLNSPKANGFKVNFGFVF